MSTSGPAASPGFVGSLRALGDGLVAGIQDRLELLSIEIQEEKIRVIQTLIWICAAILLGTLALAFASLTLVYLFWESARLTVLGALTAFYVAGTIGILVGLRRFLSHQPRPFSSTIEELARDRECIRAEH
jgi:uncharacterized membrane protein YqjE